MRERHRASRRVLVCGLAVARRAYDVSTTDVDDDRARRGGVRVRVRVRVGVGVVGDARG